MRSSRSGTGHLYAKLIAQRARFGVQIIKNFHMIGDETNRAQNDAVNSRCVLPAKMIANVGFKPWLGRRSATALINQHPVRSPRLLRNPGTCSLQLLNVR